jgi:hypothetical protein
VTALAALLFVKVAREARLGAYRSCAVEAQERSKFNDLTRDRTVFTRRTYRCPTRAEISKEERDKSMCGARPTRG